MFVVLGRPPHVEISSFWAWCRLLKVSEKRLWRFVSAFVPRTCLSPCSSLYPRLSFSVPSVLLALAFGELSLSLWFSNTLSLSPFSYFPVSSLCDPLGLVRHPSPSVCVPSFLSGPPLRFLSLFLSFPLSFFSLSYFLGLELSLRISLSSSSLSSSLSVDFVSASGQVPRPWSGDA